MTLNTEFLSAIKATLGDDFDGYLSSLENEAFRGLRVNRLKADNSILSHLDFECTPSQFSPDGYYIDNGIKSLGNHPLHHAGAFYLQEPSAMSAVTALDVQSHDRVLDLCAAPGGKSTQIASALQGTGLLISNEIVPARAKILCQNIERMGAKNAIVTCARPDELEQYLEGFFDKILVDAPCSGEGMIRREPNAIVEWKFENRQMCADRQLKILESADKMLKAGGVLVYSTCTLSEDENEQVIDKFIKSHPYYEIDEITAQFGRCAYVRFADNPDIVKARRILPQDKGEGHFVARLKKSEHTGENYEISPENSDTNPIFDEFLNQNFIGITGNIQIYRDNVSILPSGIPILRGIHILRAGVQAGMLKKNRFEPSHAIYMSQSPENIKNVLDLNLDNTQIYDFLRGYEIDCDKKGYTAVSVCGVTVGFGKASAGRLKNHYPKGLRILK